MGLDLSHGGHLSHGSPVNSSGILYKPVAYTLNPGTETVDYDNLEETAFSNGPGLSSQVLRRIHGTGIMPACVRLLIRSGIADGRYCTSGGLIARGLMNHPFPHCHIVTTTTHKPCGSPRRSYNDGQGF